jgi:hypothetical protein
MRKRRHWWAVAGLLLTLLISAAPILAHPEAVGASGVLVVLSQDNNVNASDTPATATLVLEFAGAGSMNSLAATTKLVGCNVSLDATRLVAGTPTSVTATLKGCKLDKRPSIPITLTGTSGRDPVHASVSIAVESSSPPPWELLWQALSLGFVGAAIALAIALIWASDSVSKARNAKNQLSYLAADWSFSDSWATTVTTVGAVLTSVLAATDVLNLIVGDDNKVAVFTATNIVCAALAAGAALIVLGLRSINPTDGPHVTLWGLSLGVIATLTAVYAQLWIIHRLIIDALDVGGHLKAELSALLIAGALAVLAYAITGVREILREGVTAPTPPPDSDVEKGVKLVLHALNINTPDEAAEPAPRQRMKLL